MSFCKKCYAELYPGAKRCPECGAKVGGISKKVIITIIIIILLLLLGLGGWLFFKGRDSSGSNGGKKKLGRGADLNDYIALEVDGYDGYGTVKPYIDWSGLKKALDGKIEFTDEGLEDLANGDEEADPFDYFKKYIEFYADDMVDASNGDELDYHWEIKDSAIERYFKVKFSYDDGSVKVDGLKTAEKIDAFDGVTVTFSGISPLGTAEVSIPYEFRDYLYDYDKTVFGHLKNGDEFVVTINEASVSYAAAKTGKIPAEMSKTFRVENLDYYAETLDDINQATQKAIEEEADHWFTQNKASLESTGKLAIIGKNMLLDKDCSRSFVDIKPAGNILISRKDMAAGDPKNEYYAIFEVTVNHNLVSGSDSFNKNDTFFWYMKYTNVIVNNDGVVRIEPSNYSGATEETNISFPFNVRMPDPIFYIDSIWRNYMKYPGFATPEEIYTKYALARDVNWKYEADYIN